MVSLQDLDSFLVNEVAQISLTRLVISLLIAAILAQILASIYTRYGSSISNRKSFSNNFLLMTVTTTLIITIVKSSLALSLGLVGALSIVRFRAAIKEPEELAFLFLTIGIGLGLGAGQFKVTVVSFLVISALFIVKRKLEKKDTYQNVHLTVSGKKVKLRDVVNILEKNCTTLKLKRFDQSGDEEIEASFLAEFDSFESLEKAKRELNSLSDSVNLIYLDKMGF